MEEDLSETLVGETRMKMLEVVVETVWEVVTHKWTFMTSSIDSMIRETETCKIARFPCSRGQWAIEEVSSINSIMKVNMMEMEVEQEALPSRIKTLNRRSCSVFWINSRTRVKITARRISCSTLSATIRANIARR
jgi:hypothetical protein